MFYSICYFGELSTRTLTIQLGDLNSQTFCYRIVRNGYIQPILCLHINTPSSFFSDKDLVYSRQDLLGIISYLAAVPHPISHS